MDLDLLSKNANFLFLYSSLVLGNALRPILLGIPLSTSLLTRPLFTPYFASRFSILETALNTTVPVPNKAKAERLEITSLINLNCNLGSVVIIAKSNSACSNADSASFNLPIVSSEKSFIASLFAFSNAALASSNALALALISASNAGLTLILKSLSISTRTFPLFLFNSLKILSILPAAVPISASACIF